MALSTRRNTPLVLRNRSISRDTPHHIPRPSDIINHVYNYINSTKDEVSSKPITQQIDYYSCKVSESVHICIDILLPDFNNFTNLVMIRWLTIGYSIYQLIQLWTENKKLTKDNKFITSHTRIDEWLPYIVKQKLPPNLLLRGTYHQLRKYVIMWENRELITKLPKLRGQHTHLLNDMIKWIREFKEKVQLIATQRNIAIPDSIDEQIDLYDVYLRYHSKPEPSDDEDGECPILDALRCEYLPGLCGMDESSDDESSESTHEDNEDAVDEEEKTEVQLSRKDAQILKYKQMIKELKADNKRLKKELSRTQILHCQEARQRYVYCEIGKQHKEEIDKKNEQITKLRARNIELENALNNLTLFVAKLKQQFFECKELLHSAIYPSHSSVSCGHNMQSQESNRDINVRCCTRNNTDIVMSDNADIVMSDNTENTAADYFYKDCNVSYNGSVNDVETAR